MRSLSFFIELAPSVRQDFSMQSAATLPLNEAPAFLAVMKVIAATSPAAALWSLSLRDKLRFVRTILLLQSQLRQRIWPYQQLRYWSDVPYRHGPVEVIKYCATPSSDNPAHPLRRKNPNSLQEELIRHLNEDAKISRFDFGLQFLDTDKMTYWGKRREASFWIENASIKWNETQTPFHTVARLTLVPKSKLTTEASEAVYFDVTGNSSADSTPLGSINRARWPAEVASRQARVHAATTHVADAPSQAL